ncbi:MAG: hypothetical protein J6R04_02455, partial [Clostridia bacterium]|nr:hypothetical protein [Clostridia bacterium]
IVPDDYTGTQTGLYIPTAQKQRAAYEIASDYEDGPYLIETVYVTEQVIIADIVVTPEAYGVDPTGVEDSTAGIQQALDDAAADKKGGTVFLPVGRYRVTTTIEVPAGVVLQGDWQDPDLTSKPEYGTVILADIPALTEDELTEYGTRSLFLMMNNGSCNSGLIGLTFYYPNQDIRNVQPYDYTVYGDMRMCMLRDLTFINSYRGIGSCLLGTSHELLQIENVRMTALSQGYKASESREIGYTVDLRISTDYWATATGDYACSDPAALRTWCRENAVAMEFFSLDLNQYTDITIKGYHTAMLFTGGFWGIFYGVDISDCVYGVVAEGLAGQGATIANATIEADVYGVVSYAKGGTLKLADVEMTGKGGIECIDGARIMLDNTDDLAKYDPEYGSYIRPKSILYVAEVADMDGLKEDAAPAIQMALDVAGTTGGIVYVPAGIYSLYTPLNVPTGVELRGAMEIAVRDRSETNALVPGTVFIANVPNGDLITLEESSGIQGIRIFYSTYDASTALVYLEQQESVIDTCVAIRGKGANVYAMNMVISGAFVGIDFTGCDNHLIKQTFGCTFNNFIRAGGKNGHIESVLCNQTFTMRHPFYINGHFDADYYNDENWQIHSKEISDYRFSIIRDRVLRSYCDTVVLTDAENEVMNNVFMYGCHRILRTNNSSVVCYNVTSDWQSLESMFHVENGSDVVAFNPLRTSGLSHYCDETSSLTLYNRVISKNSFEPTYRSSSGVPENALGEVIDEIELLDCDSINGVTGATLNTDPAYIKQGSGSLKQSNIGAGKADEGATVFKATFDPVDAGDLGTENIYLHMWVYVDETINLTWGGANNITLANTPNGVGYTYTWLPPSYLNTASGWTELWLPLDSGWNGRGEMDLSSLQYLSFSVNYNSLPERAQFYVDDIYICQLLPYDSTSEIIEPTTVEDYNKPTAGANDDPMRVMIENCETLDQIGPLVKGQVELNTKPEFVKEGNKSFKVTPASLPFFEIKFSATDITDFNEDGYLHMWLYIDDIGNLGTNSQIELCSGGDYDKGEKTWSLTSYLVESGWNELWIPLGSGSTATSANPKYDPSFINYMRIYASHGIGKPTFYIDDVYICNIKDGSLYDETNTDTVGSAYRLFQLPVLNACEKTTGATAVEINKKAAYIKEGKKSFKSLQNTVRLQYAIPETDISAYMDDYLHLWIYVEDISLLSGGGQIELCSGGTCDVEENSWNVKNYLTKNGWNEVWLPMDAPAASTGGELDPTRFNYLRIYIQQKAGHMDVVPVYIDDIRFVDKADVPEEIKNPPEVEVPETPVLPEAPKAEGALMLLDGETATISGLNIATLNKDATYIKGGSGSYKGGEQVRLTYQFDPVDAAGYEGGFLHLSVYVKGFDRLSSGSIELTSSGHADSQEMSWQIKNYIRNEGWNEVWLPICLQTPYCASGNAPDLSRVNFIRIYTNQADGAVLYFDDIYLAPNALGTKANEGKHVLFDGESIPVGMYDHTSKGYKVSQDQVKEGSSSIHSSDFQVRLIYSFLPLDITAYEGGYLHMWVYVTDHATIKSGNIELTSSGVSDVDEMSWSVLDHLKQDGWNEVWLPISTDRCSPSTGVTDLSSVNYLRLFTIRTGNVASSSMYFDDVYFTMTK